MERSTQLLAVIVAIQFTTFSARAGELRTYRFVPDGSLPYTVSCGECGPPFLGWRADIAGTFTVALDQAAGTGTLVALNDHLVNVFDWLSSPTGPVLKPADPAEWDFGIIPEWNPELHPPLDGVLSSDGDVLRLISDGSRRNPDGTIMYGLPSFTIAMQGDQASLNMVVPIDDWFITVTNAAARITAASSRGDYNGDGSVDAADYVVWAKYGGTQSGFEVWRANFGMISGSGSGARMDAAVPEPTGLFVALIGTLAMVNRRRASMF